MKLWHVLYRDRGNVVDGQGAHESSGPELVVCQAGSGGGRRGGGGSSRMRITALLACVFLAGIGVGRAAGQGSSAPRAPRMWSDRILDVPTDEIPRQTHVWVNFDHWAPGAETGRHTHPGPTVFVLLEGELDETFADGRTRTLKAGQAYWKPVSTDHNVRNRGDKPARALAVHLDPR